jgi:Uma2 family endonuclease
MVMPALRRRHWTAADVRALMDESRAWPRYELIDGELLVTPAPGSWHQLVVGELFRAIADYIEAEQLGVAMLSPADLELKPESITQPDIFVIPRAIVPDVFATSSWESVKALLLAVEVISPTSMRTDRVDKRDFYMEVGVPEYWVVDFDARAVERWVPAQETPMLVRDELVWHPATASRPFSLNVADFFARLLRVARGSPTP